MKFEVGDFVVLKKKAIKEFYGSVDRPLDFVREGHPNWDKFDTEAFVEFVGQWLGFESGDRVGTVSGTGADINTIRVNFIDYVTDEINFCYYADRDLEKVKVEII